MAQAVRLIAKSLALFVALSVAALPSASEAQQTPVAQKQGGSGTSAAANTPGGVLTQSGSITSGHCLEGTSSGVVDAGAPCGSGGGGGGGGSLAVGSSSVTGGTSGAVLYDNGGVLGNLTTVPVSAGGTGTSTPSLVAGTNVSISGTWPNQTINSSGGAGGLAVGTSVVTSGTSGYLLYNNAGILGNLGIVPVASGGTGTATPALVAGTNVSITGSWPNQTISASGGSGGGISNNYDISSATYGSCTTSTTDSASCIQAAINACYSASGGTVWVPAGTWKVASQITLKPGCALQGVAPPHFNYPTSSFTGGSVISVNWGSGSNSSSTAAILMNEQTAIRQLGFDYPSQNATASSPTVYGSTILAWGTQGNTEQNVEDCFFNKSYIAIDFRGSLRSSAGLGVAWGNLNNNQGSPISIGIAVDFLVDWMNITNNHFNSGVMQTSSPYTGLPAWAQANGTAFYFGGNDWVSSSYNQVFGYSIGYSLNPQAGYAGGGPYTIDNSTCDGCYTGVYLNGTFLQTVQITNSRFTSFNPATNARGAVVADSSGTVLPGLIFTSNYIFGPGNYIIWLGQSSQSISAVVAANNVSEVTGGNTGFVFASGDRIQVYSNMGLGAFGTPVTLGSATNTYVANNDTPSGGSSCSTNCSISGQFSTSGSTTPQYSFGSSTGTYGLAGSTVGWEISGTDYASVSSSGFLLGSGVPLSASATISTSGQFLSTGSTTPQFTFGSGTGVYGVAGSTVGLEISNSPLMSVSGFALTLGSGVHGFQDGGGSWYATSDARTKRNINDYRLGLDDLKALHPVSFEYNGKLGSHDDGTRYVGLIAQAVQGTSFAGMVVHHKDAESGEDVLALDNSQLTFALVNAVVTLSKQVDALKKQRTSKHH